MDLDTTLRTTFVPATASHWSAWDDGAPSCECCGALDDLYVDRHSQGVCYYCSRCLAKAGEPHTFEDLGCGD